MLVDVKFQESFGDGRPVRLSQGVYEIKHFNFDHEIGLRGYDNKYPELTGIGCYGVCDDWQQVVQQCAELQPERPGLYVMSVTPIRKSEQSSSGGWRWHKWGAYIGTGEPTTEYLYDEPDFELVYVYSVYRMDRLSSFTKTS